MRIKQARSAKKGVKMYVLWTVAISFVVSMVVYTVQSVSLGSKLSTVERDSKTLEKENRELAQLLVSKASLMEVEKRSQDLGFASPESTIYLEVPEAVAKLP